MHSSRGRSRSTSRIGRRTRSAGASSGAGRAAWGSSRTQARQATISSTDSQITQSASKVLIR